jgi:hypothetical protein
MMGVQSPTADGLAELVVSGWMVVTLLPETVIAASTTGEVISGVGNFSRCYMNYIISDNSLDAEDVVTLSFEESPDGAAWINLSGNSVALGSSSDTYVKAMTHFSDLVRVKLTYTSTPIGTITLAVKAFFN